MKLYNESVTYDVVNFEKMGPSFKRQHILKHTIIQDLFIFIYISFFFFFFLKKDIHTLIWPMTSRLSYRKNVVDKPFFIAPRNDLERKQDL